MRKLYSLFGVVAGEDKLFSSLVSFECRQPLMLSKRPVKNMATTREVPP
jgi:hypothetical protein